MSQALRKPSANPAPAARVVPLRARAMKRSLSLDVLRGVALLLVLFHHNAVFPEARGAWYWPIVHLSQIGGTGVDLFFVLSGFLVGGLLLDEYRKRGKIDAKRFIIRRGFKIWPVYYIFLAAWMLAQHFGKDAGWSALFADHWPNLVHIQNYFPSTFDLGWFWSLAVEEHFYLALPLAFVAWSITKPKRAWALRGFALVAMACFALRAYALRNGALEDSAIVFPTHFRVDSLLAGVAVAVLMRFYPQAANFARKNSLIMVAAGAVLFFSPGFMPAPNPAWSFVVLWLGAALAVAGASQLELGPSVGSRAIAWVGVRSYSIYVWHGFFAQPIANRIAQAVHLRPDTPWVGFAYELLYWAIPLVLGALSFSWIETPFLRLRDRLF